MIEKLDLPKPFEEDFEKDFGKDFLEKYKQCFNQKAIRGLRLNILKTNENDFNKLFNKLEKVPFFHGAYYLDTDEKLGNSVLHKLGAYYIQEPSSMVPVASVQDYDFNDKLILDLCASPGGKSTQIASLMQSTGILFSNEIDSKRAKELFSNIERLGIKNSICLNETPKNIANKFEGVFDYVFVDAPCSGEGMFRKDSVAIKEWNQNLKYFNKTRQLEIMEYANKCLKQNGIMVYSTCTFNTTENESVINDFINQHNYLVLEVNAEVKRHTLSGKIIDNNEELKNTRHFFPFISNGEGQFVAVLKKQEESTYSSIKPIKNNLTQAESKIVKEFLEQNTNVDYNDFTFEKVGNQINMSRFNVETNGLRVISKGVILGEIEKNRLIVHNHFASSFGNSFIRYVNFELNSLSVKKYLKGEELNVNLLDGVISQNISNGIGVIKVENIPLGEIKIVDNQIKNHYPKGLRLNKLI